MFLDGKYCKVPFKVALMLKVKPAAARTSASLTLLVWYDLFDELILVLERPVPCTDLIDYLRSVESVLQGHVAKVSSWWRVSVFLVNLVSCCLCPLPLSITIKLCLCVYCKNQLVHIPKVIPDNYNRAEPATLWQLGVRLLGILHRLPPIRSCDLSFSESRFRTHAETHRANFLDSL